jgi:hypothetical protein
LSGDHDCRAALLGEQISVRERNDDDVARQAILARVLEGRIVFGARPFAELRKRIVGRVGPPIDQNAFPRSITKYAARAARTPADHPRHCLRLARDLGARDPFALCLHDEIVRRLCLGNNTRDAQSSRDL